MWKSFGYAKYLNRVSWGLRFLKIIFGDSNATCKFSVWPMLMDIGQTCTWHCHNTHLVLFQCGMTLDECLLVIWPLHRHWVCVFAPCGPMSHSAFCPWCKALLNDVVWESGNQKHLSQKALAETEAMAGARMLLRRLWSFVFVFSRFKPRTE